MAQASLKAKVLNYFNPEPTLPISNLKIPRSNTTSHLTRSHDLTQSQSSINRNSYLNHEDILTQHITNKLTINRSNSNKKQKLNVVSNPHRLVLTPNQNKSDSRIKYDESKVSLEGSRKKYSRLQMSRMKDQEGKLGIKRSSSLRSFNTVEIKIEGKTHRPNRQTLILKEKVIPVHIRTINNPQQPLPGRFGRIEVSEPPTPIRRLNLPSEISSRTQFNQFHPSLVLSHDLPAQAVIRVIQKRELPFNFQAPQPFRPHNHEKVNSITKDSKIINNSPSGFIRHQKCPHSPMINAQSKRTQTPSMIATPPRGSNPSSAASDRRSSSQSMIQRSLQMKRDVINGDQLKHSDLTGRIIPNTLKMNSQQKVLTLLSQNTLPIKSRQQSAELNLNQKHLSQVGQVASHPNNQQSPVKPRKQLNHIPEVPLSVPLSVQMANTNHQNIRQQSQHKLQLSPNPVKQQPKEDNHSSLTKPNRQILEDQPKISPLLEQSNEKNRQKKQTSTVIVPQQKNIRQNHFISQLSQQLESIQNQRMEKENSIAKRLQQLSERANSIVRMHSQESRRSPDPPTKEQPLASCSTNPKTKSLVLCATQSQQTLKTYDLSAEAMKLSFAFKEKQNLHPPSNPTRSQILTKLLL